MPKKNKNTKRNKNMNRNKNSMVPRPMSNKSVLNDHHFYRTWNLNIPMNASTGFFGAGFDLEFNFALGTSNVNIAGSGVYGPALPNSSEFVNLFDQYCLKSVELIINFSADGFPVSSPTFVAPLFSYIVDYDDSTSVALNDILQYPMVRHHNFLTNGYKPLHIRLKPRPLMDIASTGMLTSYAPSLNKDVWLSTSYSSTPHYGVKLIWNTFGVSNNVNYGQITIYCKIGLAFRNPK
jgi:hypothetical protein